MQVGKEKRERERLRKDREEERKKAEQTTLSIACTQFFQIHIPVFGYEDKRIS